MTSCFATVSKHDIFTINEATIFASIEATVPIIRKQGNLASWQLLVGRNLFSYWICSKIIKKIYALDKFLACVQTFPLPQKKIGRRDVCESMSLIVFRLHLHKLLFFVFFSDSWNGVDRPTRLWTFLEHVRSYSLGCSQPLWLS